MDRRGFLGTGPACLAGSGMGRETLAAPGTGTEAAAGAGEVLYSGIRLPAEWPPRIKEVSADPPPLYLGSSARPS